MKPVLFISRYCKHCESVVMRLQRHEVLDKFTVVDVDASQEALPPQITHVPSVMTQVNGRLVVLQESQLVKFVDTLLGAVENNTNHHHHQQQQPSSSVVEPCVGGKCSYAFLDGYETLDQPDTSYSSFDVVAATASDAGLLMSPSMVQASQDAMKLREGDGALDKLVSSRNTDIQRIAGPQSPAPPQNPQKL